MTTDRFIEIVGVLKEYSGSLDVVFLGRNVQSWKMDLSCARVVLQQKFDDFVVALLKSHSEWCEPILNTHRKRPEDQTRGASYSCGSTVIQEIM